MLTKVELLLIVSSRHKKTIYLYERSQQYLLPIVSRTKCDLPTGHLPQVISCIIAPESHRKVPKAFLITEKYGCLKKIPAPLVLAISTSHKINVPIFIEDSYLAILGIKITKELLSESLSKS